MPETWQQWLWFWFFTGGALGGWAALALVGLWYGLMRKVR